MIEPTPIREYEEAVYVYWFGPNLSAVKIGHSNDPDTRLAQLGNDTGVPDHLASFAAIVWLDRKREKVEALAHSLAAPFRRSGEWFELSPSEALAYVISAAKELNIRYEVEDRAGLLPATREAMRMQDLERELEAERKFEEKEKEAEKARRLEMKSHREAFGLSTWGPNWRGREAEVIQTLENLAHAEKNAILAPEKVTRTKMAVAEGEANRIAEQYLRARIHNAMMAIEEEATAKINLRQRQDEALRAQIGMSDTHKEIVKELYRDIRYGVSDEDDS